MRRTVRAGALAALMAAGLPVAPALAANINVSQIATGTYTGINWNVAAMQARVYGWTVSYATVAVAGIDTEPTAWFAPDPWGAGLQPNLAYPALTRTKPTQNYTQGNAQFLYDSSYSRLANVDMTTAAPRKVEAGLSGGGASGAKVTAALSYRAHVDNTTAQTLDYYFDLKVPVLKRGTSPAYDLCCSGDSNGGTYNYHSPQSADSRAAVDVEVDGLPVWSSEAAYTYPATNSSSPFDEVDIAWDQPNGPGTTTLYLGRVAPGHGMDITFIARADARDLASYCGIQGPSSYLSHDYEVHCFGLDHRVEMANITNRFRGPQPPFSIYAKAALMVKKPFPVSPSLVQAAPPAVAQPNVAVRKPLRAVAPPQRVDQ